MGNSTILTATRQPAPTADGSHSAAHVRELELRLDAVGVATTATPEDIARLTSEVKRQHGAWSVLRQVAQRYEASCRLAVRQERRQALDAEIALLEQQQRALEQQSAALRAADTEAQGWAKPLARDLDTSLETQITVHQPEMMRVFRMLVPCAFRFQDITMRRGAGGIELGLQYRGCHRAAGEPMFFLSQAQANVLALAIFLSFAARQSWSKLDTLLMDDPVQHLDDLDAVAFLDRLRAIATAKGGAAKQLIVSTCDRNLYLLMLRKFNQLNSMGHRFVGLSLTEGVDSPQIVHDVGGAEPVPQVA